MLAGQFVFLFAVLLLSSLFMPWVALPFGGKLVPWAAVSTVIELSATEPAGARLSGDRIGTLIIESSELALMLASFAIAVCAGLLAMLNACPRCLAFVSGAIPSGVIAYHATVVDDAAAGSSSRAAERMLAQLDIGLAAYVAGGAGLLCTSLMRKDWPGAPHAKGQRVMKDRRSWAAGRCARPGVRRWSDRAALCDTTRLGAPAPVERGSQDAIPSASVRRERSATVIPLALRDPFRPTSEADAIVMCHVARMRACAPGSGAV